MESWVRAISSSSGKAEWVTLDCARFSRCSRASNATSVVEGTPEPLEAVGITDGGALRMSRMRLKAAKWSRGLSSQQEHST